MLNRDNIQATECKLIENNDCQPINKHLNLLKDMIKYGFVSVLSMVVDVGILYILVEHVHMYYMYATTIAFCFALVLHFALVKIFVYKSNKTTLFKEFFWYTLIGLIGLVLNNIIIYVLVWLQIWYLYAKLISVVTVFFFNFFGRRRLFQN